MNRFLLFALFLALLSCDQEKTQESEYKTKVPIPTRTEGNPILGEWAMCSTFENGRQTIYNVCPKITFAANGTGTILNAANEKQEFRWELKNKALKITNTMRKPNNWFSDATYSATVTKENESTRLIIQDTKNDHGYNLAKSNG